MSEMTFNRAQRLGNRRKARRDYRPSPRHYRAGPQKCWMVGREYLHVSPDGVPKKTVNACTTVRLSTSGLRACQRNSRVRANEDLFMLSGLLDVRRNNG